MSKAGIAISTLVVLIGVGTAGAWYTGTRLEGVLQQSIEQGNQQLAAQLPGAGVALELVGFQRGLFSSQARYRLVLRAAEDDQPAIDLFINDHIEHGPMPLSRLRSFKWLPVMAVSRAQLEPTAELAELFAASAGQAPVTLVSSIGYGQGISGELQVAPLSWTGDEAKGTFSGLSALYRTDTAGDRLAVSGRVDSLELELEAPGRIGLVGVEFALDRRRDTSGLYLGNGRVALDQLAVMLDGQPALVMSDVLQTDHTHLDADGVKAELNYQVGSFSYDGKPLGSMNMGWSLSRLDPQATLLLTGLYNRLALGSEPDDPGVLAEQFREALQQLLQHQPRLALNNFSIRTANGESRFSLGMELGNPDSLEQPAEQLAHQLIGSLEANLVLSKPMLMDVLRYQALFQPHSDAAALEQEAALMVEMASGMAEMMQLGRVEGDNILSSLRYADGMIELNGQRIPLEDFVGLLVGLQQAQ